MKRLKDSAKASKDRTKQLKAQANLNADQLKMQRSRQKLSQKMVNFLGPVDAVQSSASQ